MLKDGSSCLGRKCRKCGQFYPLDQIPYQFTRERPRRRPDQHVNPGGRREAWGEPVYRTDCNKCRQIARDRLKQANRYVDKARRTIRHHADDRGMPPGEFSKLYQWRPKQIAHEIEHAEKNGCCYCLHPYAEMGHGLADITVDIYDQRFEPVWGANTRICCRTCNSKKRHMSLEEWIQVCRAFREQESFLALLALQPAIIDIPKQADFFAVVGLADRIEAA